MSTAPKTRTLLETLGPGRLSRPLRAAQSSLTDTDEDLWHAEQPGRFTLHREAELPQLLTALGTADQTQAHSADAPDRRPPDELATPRAERRQIAAVCRVVCQAVAEVLVGLRPANQLHRWVVPEVHEKVRQRAELLARHRGESAVQARQLTFGAIRTTRLRTGIWEASVVFSDQQRVRACAMRLEAHRRRWRVAAMELG